MSQQQKQQQQGGKSPSRPSWAGIKDSETQQIVYVYNPAPEGPYFLGKGQFGTVYKGHHWDASEPDKNRRMGQAVAIKKMNLMPTPEFVETGRKTEDGKPIFYGRIEDLDEQELQEYNAKVEDIQKSIKSEIAVFKKLSESLQRDDWRNLVQVKGVYQTGSNNVYIIMQYCQKGSLEQLMHKRQKFSEREAVYIVS